MSGAKLNESLEIQSEFELGRRTLSGSIGQIFLFSIFTLGLSVSAFSLSDIKLLGVLIVGLNFIKFFLGYQQPLYYPHRRRRWKSLFVASTIVSSISWSIAFFLILHNSGLASYAATITVLTGSGLAAGLAMTHSPYLSLARVDIAILLGVPFLELLLKADRQSIPMAVIFIAYYVFLWFQINVQNSDLWQGNELQLRLREDRNRLQQVFDAIPGLVAWIGSDLHLRGVNKNYAFNYGADREEFIGKNIEFRNHDIEFLNEVNEFSKSNDEQTVQEVLMSSRGTQRWNLVVMHRPVDHEIYLICLDIHDLKMIREELSRERAKVETVSRLAAIGEIAAGITHDIRNPFTSLVSIIELIRKEASETKVNPERVIDLGDRAIAIAGRITRIISSLMALSRRTEAEPYILASLSQVVKDSVELTNAQFLSSQVSLQVSLPKKDLYVNCRPIEISRVLVNLLSNAIDASKREKHKWVRMEVGLRDGMISIAVTDSGPGIAKDVSEKMFDLLFTTKPIGEGTGLGLSISRRIIERHGGELRYEPYSPHTTFLVLLPEAEVGLNARVA